MVRPAVWAPLGVFAAAFIAYWPALSGEFVNWDDDVNIVHAEGLRDFGARGVARELAAFHLNRWVPVSRLTLAADSRLWGLNPFGFHLTNLILHGLNAVALYGLALALLPLAAPRLGGGALRGAAVAAALFFAAHPLRAESVAWASSRPDLLATLFLQLSLIAYVRGRRALSCLAYAASLGSKVFGLSLPAVLVVLDVHPLGRLPASPRALGRRHWRVWLEKVPFVLLALAAQAWALFGQMLGPGMVPVEQFGWGRRLGQAAFGLCFYPAKTLWPSGLSPWYSDSGPGTGLAALCAAAAAAAAWGAWRARRRWPAVPALALAYAAMILPFLGLVKVGRHLAADRYSYMACLGLALAAGWAWAEARRRRPGPAAAAGAALLALLVASSWRQASFWRDSVSLWSRAVACDPGARWPRLTYALALIDAGSAREALAQARAAERPSAAERLPRPRLMAVLRDYGAHRSVERGIELFMAGRPREALGFFETALEFAPGQEAVRSNIRAAEAALGRGGP